MYAGAATLVIALEVSNVNVVVNSFPTLLTIGGKNVESFRNHSVIEQKITQKSIKRVMSACMIFVQSHDDF